MDVISDGAYLFRAVSYCITSNEDSRQELHDKSVPSTYASSSRKFREFADNKFNNVCGTFID